MCIIKLLKAGDKMEKWNCLNPINLEYDIIVIYIYIVIVIFYNKKITVKLIGKEWYLVITEKGIDS